jgi:hypothetical protein
MANEEENKRHRIVVNTPTSSKEYLSSETARVPARSGMSGGTVAAVVVGVVALMTIVFLFLMNRQNEDRTNANLQVATTSTTTPPPATQQPVIVQQPAVPPQQQPVIIQQPATTTTQPIVVAPQTTAPASQPTVGSGAPKANVTDDTTIQSTIDKKLSDDTALSAMGLTATVLDGKVMLTGTVKSDEQKTRAEKVVRGVKGVREVDNQIIVSASPY